MNDNSGRRRNVPAGPTAEPVSDPVPTGDDVIAGEEHQPPRTPQRHDEPAGDDDVALPSNDSTLNTQI